MTHADAHTHSDAAYAAQAQREATMIGRVGDRAIPRARLDARVRELRAGRLASRLPAVGSKEDRQFLRWTAQVLLTEELCRVELARLAAEKTETAGRVAAGAASSLGALAQAESLHLGSINAAAWSRCPEMSELFDLVTAPTTPTAPPSGRRTWYRVAHAVAATPIAADAAPLRSLGWTTLADLPTTLGAELRAMPTGIRVGPVRSALGWHVATVTATELRPDPRAGATTTAVIDPSRLAAFNRWLDERRCALVSHAPGFEHPGDPSQPDNTHRH